MITITTEYSNTVIDIINIILQIGVLIVACFALWQLKLMKDQNALTRESVAINELREFEKVISDFSIFLDLIRDSNVKKLKLDSIEMSEFTLSESSTELFKDKIRIWHEFYQENPRIYTEAMKCANKIEILATAVTKGPANLEIIQDSILNVFCEIVENLSYLYIFNRNSAINVFKNTIYLYKKFKPIAGKRNENMEKIKKEVELILENK